MRIEQWRLQCITICAVHQYTSKILISLLIQFDTLCNPNIFVYLLQRALLNAEHARSATQVMESSAYELINLFLQSLFQAQHKDVIHRIHAIRWRHAFKPNLVSLVFAHHITVAMDMVHLDVCRRIIRWMVAQAILVKMAEPV